MSDTAVVGTTPVRPAVSIRRSRRGSAPSRVLRTGLYHAAGIVLAVGFLFPLVSSALNSVKTPAGASASPPTVLPLDWSLGNYIELLSHSDGLMRYLGNTLVVSGVAVGLAIVVSTLGGYAFARYQFRGKNLVFLAVIAVLMVPQATLVLPLYLMFARAGMQNSLIAVGVIVMVFQLPFGIFLMRNSVESVPAEIEEASKVDGCTAFGTFVRVTLPLVVPGIVTVALFVFITAWNEYLVPLLMLNDGSSFTLSLMLVNIRSGAYGSIDWGMLQAGMTVAVIPCVLLYILLQRFFIGGLTEGSLRA